LPRYKGRFDWSVRWVRRRASYALTSGH